MSIVKTLQYVALTASLAGASFASASAFAAENPMEHSGIAHNLYLDCLMQSENSSVSPLVRLVDECGYDTGMRLEAFIESYQSDISIDPRVSLRERVKASGIAYSDNERNLLFQVDDIVRMASDEKEALDHLSVIEQEAIHRLSAKSASGSSVLAFFSTMRHSYAYWSKTWIGKNADSSARIRDLLIVASVDAFATAAAGPGVGSSASAHAAQALAPRPRPSGSQAELSY